MSLPGSESYTVDSESVQYFFLEYLSKFFVHIISAFATSDYLFFSINVTFLLQLEQNIQVKYVNQLWIWTWKSNLICVTCLVNSRMMPVFRKRSKTCCMDFLVLMNSIERNTYHSCDVLLAHLLITAVVSWSLFMELVQRLAKRLSVLEKTGLTI